MGFFEYLYKFFESLAGYCNNIFIPIATALLIFRAMSYLKYKIQVYKTLADISDKLEEKADELIEETKADIVQFKK